MTLFYIIQKLPEAPPTSDVKDVLSWAIGILITAVLGTITYFTIEKKRLINEIKEKDQALQREVEYSKQENKDTVKLMTEVSIFMKNQTTVIDKNSDTISKMNSILESIDRKLDNYNNAR